MNPLKQLEACGQAPWLDDLSRSLEEQGDLAAAGAQTQRLLGASTNTKDPALRNTVHVEALVGRDTVDTIPPASMDAFRDRGAVKTNMIEQGPDAAHATPAALKASGVSIHDIAEDLVDDGVQKFAESFDALLGAIFIHRRDALGERARWRIGETSGQAS